MLPFPAGRRTEEDSPHSKVPVDRNVLTARVIPQEIPTTLRSLRTGIAVSWAHRFERSPDSDIAGQRTPWRWDAPGDSQAHQLAGGAVL